MGLIPELDGNIVHLAVVVDLDLVNQRLLIVERKIVSLVVEDSAVRTVCRSLPLLAEDKNAPVSNSIRRKGLRERSVLFRSSEIIW